MEVVDLELLPDEDFFELFERVAKELDWTCIKTAEDVNRQLKQKLKQHSE